jgi:hypothetical protein
MSDLRGFRLSARHQPYHRPIVSQPFVWWDSGGPGPGKNRQITLIVLRRTFRKEGNMDHNEAVRKLEHLMLREADHAKEVATELEALVTLLPSGKSRELAQLQIKASHKQAKDFRELAQKAKEH